MGGREDSIGLSLMKEREDGVGKRGSGVSDVEIEIESGEKVEVEEGRMKMKKVETKELRHLQVLRRRWTDSVGQSCDSQCRKGR